MIIPTKPTSEARPPGPESARCIRVEGVYSHYSGDPSTRSLCSLAQDDGVLAARAAKPRSGRGRSGRRALAFGGRNDRERVAAIADRGGRAEGKNGLRTDPDVNEALDKKEFKHNLFIEFAIHSPELPFIKDLRLKGGILLPFRDKTGSPSENDIKVRIVLEIPIGGVKRF